MAALVRTLEWIGSATWDCQLAIGPSWVASAWKMQPNHANMDKRECLSSLILSSSRSPASAKPSGSKRPPGVTSPWVRLRERVLEDAGAVRFRGANEEDLDREHGPEVRVARARRRERRDGARELVRHRGAVIRRAQRARGEPRDSRAVLRRPRPGHAEHGPSAVNDLALRVLFVAERNDRRLAAARVRAELRVQVRRRERPELSRLFRIVRSRASIVSPPRLVPSRVARVRVRLARVASCFLADVAVDRQRYDLVDVARDRTLKADFFAGALALVRRATTAVSILRDGRATWAPRRRARR